jgi:hypothetical protein
VTTDVDQTRHRIGRRRVVIGVVALVIVLGLAVYATSRILESRKSATPDGAFRTHEPRNAEGATSRHGDDYSYGAPDGRTFTVCDKEPDGNPVRGVFDFDTATPGGDGALDDLDGAGGTCASIKVNERIVRHRTCERNYLAWDCGNWTANEWPPSPTFTPAP